MFVLVMLQRNGHFTKSTLPVETSKLFRSVVPSVPRQANQLERCQGLFVFLTKSEHLQPDGETVDVEQLGQVVDG